MKAAAVLELVRTAPTRSFVCGRCGADGVVLVTTGPAGRLPARCEACNPISQTWTRERSERPLRALILLLDARVRELETERRERPPVVTGSGPAPDAIRGRRYGPPGREALGRANRAVVRASGAAGTRAALLDLAAAATAWAWLLGSKDDR